MTRLRFATLNLQNLQLPHEAMHPRSKAYGATEYDRKLAWLADVLKRLDADVIGMQELWSPRCMQQLLDKAGLTATHTLIVDGVPNAVGQEITTALAVRKPCVALGHAFVSQFPPGFTLRKRPQPKPAPDYEMAIEMARFSKPVLRCEVRPPQGDPILVFVAHLKSRLPIELDGEETLDGTIRPHQRAVGEVLATVRRTVEAGALRVLIEQATLAGARPVVVMGDVNDSPGSRTHAILTGEPPLMPDDPVPSAHRGEAALYSPTSFLDPRGPAALRPTFMHFGRYEAFDQIFVSAHFHPHSRRRQWAFRGLRVLNDHLDEREGDDAQRIVSDHGIVAATFQYAPAT